MARILNQCTWGKETAKKARTQQHFESLMNHIKGLERRVHELEGELQHYRDPSAQPEAGPSGLTSSLSDKASPHAKSESDDADGQLDDPSSSSNEGSDIDKLIAPTRNLVVCDLIIDTPSDVTLFAAWRARS